MARKKTKKSGKTIDDCLDYGQQTRVYVLSELGYDTVFFNECAYENLLQFMSLDKELDGVILDGAITRLDRPEYLSERLSYWEKDQDECLEETEKIPNNRQYQSMMNEQLLILEERIQQLKERVPQAKKIVLSIDSDDIQYTISAMLNEMLVRGQKEIRASIKELISQKQEIASQQKRLQKEYGSIEGEKGLGRKRAGLEKRMKTCETRVESIEGRIKDKYDEQNLYREKKVRPAHQFFTARFVKKLYKKYEDLCNKLDVELVTSPGILSFGNMQIDYAHSRHSTWAVLKRRDKAFITSTHGKKSYQQEQLERDVKQKGEEGVDVILESGHSGIGFKQFQKTHDSIEEINFKNQSLYDPEMMESHVSVVLAIPFEDQEKIGGFVKGKEPIRLSGGKPIHTRKHSAIDRYNNNSVSGLTVITKNQYGVVGTEWVQYANFLDGLVLNQPEEYSIICASADEHIGSPEENLIALDGWQEFYLSLLTEPVSFRGKRAFAKGYINGGDAAEANSKKWDHRYHHKRDPRLLIRENLDLISKYKPKSMEEVLQLVMKFTNDSLGGSVESMAVILERVARYYETFLENTLETSMLRWVHVVTTGNHADNVLRDLGLRETDFFVQRQKAKERSVCQVGVPDYFGEGDDARIFVGGYSNARVLNIADYGLDINGEPIFGPINLLVQHDPKGGGVNGLVGAGKNSNADLALGAHTHENWLRLYKTRDNEFSVAYRLATLQTVSPTEKYYASSLPRTQAAHCLVMPMSGDFSELAIPAGFLASIGRKVLQDKLVKYFKK